jgi:hypothetical protein
VSIPLYQNTGRAMTELRHVLKKVMTQYYNASPKGDFSSTAKWKVHRNPVLSSLHETLKIWRSFKEHNKQGKKIKHYELADYLELPVSKAHTENDQYAKNVKSAVISNALREAKNLIWNVGQGRFPDSETPHPDLYARRLKREADRQVREQTQEGQVMDVVPRRRGRYR